MQHIRYRRLRITRRAADFLGQVSPIDILVRLLRNRGGRVRTLALVLGALAGFGDAAARSSGFEPSWKEFYVYPPYCKARMAASPLNRDGRWKKQFPINEKQVAFWRQRIGPDWDNLQDFCVGLTYLSRAKDPGYLHDSGTSAKVMYSRAAGLIGEVHTLSEPRNPFWQELTLRYAEAAGGAGDYQQAMKLLSDLIELNPKNADAYVLQAQLTERRDLNAAIGYLEAGLAAGARPGAILYHLAYDFYKLGDFERAREYTQRAEQAGMKMDRLKSKLP
jgi:tetratricopeptide (TPR) repeat protein